LIDRNGQLDGVAGDEPCDEHDHKKPSHREGHRSLWCIFSKGHPTSLCHAVTSSSNAPFEAADAISTSKVIRSFEEPNLSDSR
jgi:hypothetical protein